jgi:hypothetical protein
MGRSALHQAVKSDIQSFRAKSIRLLMSAGIDINIKDKVATLHLKFNSGEM